MQTLLQKPDTASHFICFEHESIVQQTTDAFTNTKFLFLHVDNTGVTNALLRPVTSESQKISVVGKDYRLLEAGISELFFVAQTKIPDIPR
jgi:hypothetical protein